MYELINTLKQSADCINYSIIMNILKRLRLFRDLIRYIILCEDTKYKYCIHNSIT